MKVKRAACFFSDEENEKIKDAVRSAEMNTSGEIAIMVVDRSDSYREAETLGAVLLSGLLALLAEVLIEYSVISVASPDWTFAGHKGSLFFLYGISIWTYIPIVFLLYFPAKVIFRRYPLLKLPFVGRKRIDEAVRERAVRAFYEKGLYKTRDETGVLIFISLMERKVWILGDRGINRKIPHSGWKEFARSLSMGVREDNVCAALCSVIENLGRELAVHFPKKADDANELSDEVLT